MSQNRVPNPDGRKGGTKHREKVDEVSQDFERRGFDYVKELFFDCLTERENS